MPQTKIGKTQLVEQLCAASELNKKQSVEVVDHLTDIIRKALLGGNNVAVPGLGTFKVRQTPARTANRPGSSEKIEVPAGRKISFTVASDLKTKL